MLEPPTPATLLPRFHVTTFGAPAPKVYSPRSLSVHVHEKFTPAPPAGMLAVAGDGPVQLAVPPATLRSLGETFGTATLLCPFSVTFTVPPWRTKLLPTVTAVSSTAGGPGSLPGSAAIGT